MRLRRLADATTLVTFVLLVMGVYTKEVGADLTCDMRWPLCDGGAFGLLPATVPSFIEWFHRLLAFVVALAALALLYRAYRFYGTDGRVTRATALAVALLPFQAVLGALTVRKFALFGEQAATYGPYISTAHYGSGMLVFAALLAATLWVREDPPGGATDTPAAAAAPGDD